MMKTNQERLLPLLLHFGTCSDECYRRFNKQKTWYKPDKKNTVAPLDRNSQARTTKTFRGSGHLQSHTIRRTTHAPMATTVCSGAQLVTQAKQKNGEEQERKYFREILDLGFAMRKGTHACPTEKYRYYYGEAYTPRAVIVATRQRCSRR